MTPPKKTPSASPLRWNGMRVMFEIERDGQGISCAISRAALQQICGPKSFLAADLLQSFAKVRGQIERIALAKLDAAPENISGIVSIWEDDVEAAQAVRRSV